MFEIKNPYLSSYSPFLIIFIMKLMMIWCYSFKNKTSGGPWDQKKRDLDLWSPKIYIAFHVWYSKSLSIILFPISNHIHHEGNDDFDVNLINRRHLEDPEVKRRKIWILEIYIACHVWNSKSFFIILFPISNYIHHERNYDLMLFFQIQNIWGTLKSKEGRFGSLKFI